MSTHGPIQPATDATPAGADTRERLLAAAGEVFAEHGFARGQVREICRRAGANVAAVNYHFGDKAELYRAVLRFAHTCAAPTDALFAEIAPDLPGTEKLRRFIHALLRQMLDEGRPAWHGKLMAREMVDPTDALDEIVEYEIKPKFALLRSIVGEIVRLPADSDPVRWNAASVIAQCLFFHHNRPVNIRLYPDLVFTPERIAWLADRITHFSLDGLHGEARRIVNAGRATSPENAR